MVSRRLSAKNAKVCRPTLFNYIFTREEFEKYVDDWFALLTGPNKLNIKIHKIYPLADVQQAHMVGQPMLNHCTAELSANMLVSRTWRDGRRVGSCC
jgi:hypothetical protein